MKASLFKSDLIKLKNQLENIKSELENPQSNLPDEIKIELEKKFTSPEEQINEILSNKDDEIVLNIGGKKFQTKKSTLLRLKNTLFYELLMHYQNSNEEVPKEIFIDRSYTHFKLILEYLRTNQFSIKGLPKLEKEEILEELEYYGLSSHLNINKKHEIEIAWHQGLSKGGACTLDKENPKKLTVHSNNCYTHFLTDRIFTNENFIIEFESTVTQTDNYYYIGLVNDEYSTSSSCMCCNPKKAFYIQCDGSVHVDSNKHDEPSMAWYGANVTIGMRVNLEEKKFWFYIPDRKESGPYCLVGNTFRVVAGHCNTGNGTITITECFESD